VRPKAGITPSRIARQFGISVSSARKALAPINQSDDREIVSTSRYAAPLISVAKEKFRARRKGEFQAWRPRRPPIETASFCNGGFDRGVTVFINSVLWLGGFCKCII
jgi:hypothetical protein